MSLGAVGQPRRSVRGSVRRTGRVVSQRELPERSRREFRDVRHPLRPELRIERVFVCPGGVHVVTTLPATLRPAADEIAPPATVSVSHMAADLVAAALPQRYRDRVRPVLCRSDEIAMAELVDGVLVTSPRTLQHIVSSAPPVLSTSEVHDVALRLDARLEPFPVAAPAKRRRWRRGHTIAAAVVAACSAAAAVAAQQAGGVPLPW